MGVIWEDYYIGSTTTTHTQTFPAVTAGHRIIVCVASYDTPTLSTPGYAKHAAADSYDHAHIYSKVATGGETSVTVTVGAATDSVLMMVQVRDDCPEVLFATSGNAADSASSIVCSPVTVPAAVGVVIAVTERPQTRGVLGSGKWTPLIPQWGPYGSYASTQSGARYFTGPLPGLGQVAYTYPLPSAGYAHAAVVAFGISDLEAPTTPPNLRTTAVTGTQIDVAWDAATDNIGVTGYGVYKDGVKQGADQAGLTKSLTGLTTGQTYTIEVDAVDAAGNRSTKTQISVLAVTDVTPPTAPSNLRLAGVTHTTATVAWDSATDDIALAGYGVYKDGVKQGADQAGLERTLTGLARGATYTIEVNAVDTAGHRSASVTVQVTTLTDTLPSAPPGLTATAGQETITLAWQPATDDLEVVRYEVLLDDELVAATSALGYVVDGLDPSTPFEVAVRAVDDGGGRGPASSVQVTTLEAGWSPVASPVYRIGEWAANARDSFGVLWVVEQEDGWSSSATVEALGEDSDSSDGGFSGQGRFGARLITLEGTAIAPSRMAMLAAQERLTGLLSPQDVAVLRVTEAHLTRQAQVRLADEATITDQGMLAFTWSLTTSAGDPRRYRSRSIYQEVALPVLPGQASMTITLEGDYPTVPVRMRLYGPIRDFAIAHQESGLTITSKPGTVLTDSRYSLEMNLGPSRVVWAHVPPEVWPEPRPGRSALAVLPTRWALQPGTNTIVVAGQPVAGHAGVARLVVETADAWR